MSEKSKRKHKKTARESQAARDNFPQVFFKGFFLRFLKEKDKNASTTMPDRKGQRMPRDTKSTEEGPWDKHYKREGQESQGQTRERPQNGREKFESHNFHPENPWRGKLEEEEIIVLPSMVYYRGQGVK